MTVIDHATGEILTPLDRAEAERLTTRIRLRLDTIADNYVAVMPLIREAVERRAWEALNYNGVSSYVSECFGDALTKLSVDVRRVVVAELSSAGMSLRAIAPVLGVTHPTVLADRRSGGKDLPPSDLPAGSTLLGPGGAGEIASQEPTAPATALTSVEPGTAPEQVEPPASAGAARTITGLDGKHYAQPAPISEAERVARQEEQDRLDWHKRAAHYLASFMATYSLATGLRNNPERDLILAQLDVKGRDRFLQLESEHPEWTS